MGFLSDDERAQLSPAEDLPHRFPIPTQIVSSDEYFPEPQTRQQKQVEDLLADMGDRLAKRQGLSRRRFFQTASGMAAAFLAMNKVYGNLYSVSEAEAATPEMAQERAITLQGQDVLDVHTHFLRDDTKLTGFVAMRNAVGKAGWNQELSGKEQSVDDLKFDNYFKEIFLDSDTKVALLTNAPSDIPDDWFLTNKMVFDTRDRINKQAGARRLLAHYTITPGQPSWLDGIDYAIENLRPDGWKGYTIGDNTHKELAKYPWRLDDEKLMYPAYERFQKAGIKNVCIHKGLFAPSIAAKFPHLLPYAKVDDVGKAAKDWPGLNFVIYHSGYRHVGGSPADAMAEWNQTGRSSWVSDLAEIPAKYGVTNVYGDLGQLFAYTNIAEPRLAAALMGTLVKGLGADHVIWGTDAVWTGAPQWQIEGLRRLEIPEDMQKQYGFAPLGAADGRVKRMIFAENGFRLFNYDRHAELSKPDRFGLLKQDYLRSGPNPSNLRYGYVRRG